MKKIFLLLISIILSCSAYAEQTVGRYQNTYFGKEFEIEAAQKNEKLQSVYIGVLSDDNRKAFISVDGKNLESFKSALELVRDKYLEWVKVARDNNVTEMRKDFNIKFPSVNVCWKGAEWWFAFGRKVTMRFLILDDGKMVASWSPKVTASDNRYIDEQIYFVFGDEDDFNNLISQLDYQTILNKLLNTHKNEDLFQ